MAYFRKLKGFEFEGKSMDALLHASIDKDTFKRALQVPADSEVRRSHAPATLTQAHAAWSQDRRAHHAVQAITSVVPHIASLFEAFDSNKSGAVSLQEFVHGLSTYLRGSTAEQADRTALPVIVRCLLDSATLQCSSSSLM